MPEPLPGQGEVFFMAKEVIAASLYTSLSLC